MGYYVDGYGSVEFANKDEDRLVQGLKDLNHRHELKTGGRFPKQGDPYEDSWFAWMPSRYHEDETLTTVAEILELVGFEVDVRVIDDQTVLSLNYNSKTGAEQVFIEQLGKLGAKVLMHWVGEEGENWEVRAGEGLVESRETVKTWTDWQEYSMQDTVASYVSMLSEVRDAFGK